MECSVEQYSSKFSRYDTLGRLTIPWILWLESVRQWNSGSDTALSTLGYRRSCDIVTIFICSFKLFSLAFEKGFNDISDLYQTPAFLQKWQHFEIWTCLQPGCHGFSKKWHFKTSISDVSQWQCKKIQDQFLSIGRPSQPTNQPEPKYVSTFLDPTLKSERCPVVLFGLP